MAIAPHTQNQLHPIRQFFRRSREPFEVILRRFNREIQQSGIMTEVKRRKFREPELSRRLRRQIAIVKAQRRKIKRGY